MSVSESFAQHVLDLLALAGPVRAKRMFGGMGLWLDGMMFGLLDDDELFLKADAQNREEFVRAGCREWVWESKNGPMSMSYFRPPDGAFDDEEQMLPWARRGIEAARRKKAAQDARQQRGRERAAKRKSAAEKKTGAVKRPKPRVSAKKRTGGQSTRARRPTR